MPLSGCCAGSDADCVGKECEAIAGTTAGNTRLVETTPGKAESFEATAGNTDIVGTCKTVGRLPRHNVSNHA